MKPKIADSLKKPMKILFVGAVLAWLAGSATAQPVTLAVVRTNGNQVALSWPKDLSLVQPQRSTNLLTGGWADFGAATTNSTISETPGPGSAFYRLRFLAPSIIDPPKDQAVAAGATVRLEVTAIGTAPLSYQWRKNGAALAGQNSRSLSLNAVTIGDAGDYAVLVENRAGSVTVVGSLIVTNRPAAAPPRGIYIGTFTGQTNGGFAGLVRTNGMAVILAHNVAGNEGVLATNVTVAADGSVSTSGEKTGKFTGTFDSVGASGSLSGTNGVTSAFAAVRSPDTGIHQANAGFYAGTFDGLLTGSATFIMAADGTVFAYLSSATLGGGGAFGKIDAANAFAATAAYTLPGTTAPALIDIKGALNPATHQFAGTYALGAIPLGKFTMTRAVTP